MSVHIEQGWLSVSKAATYTGLNPYVIRRAIASGELRAYKKPPTYREGTKAYFRINIDDIDEWMRSQTPATEVFGNAC